MKKQLVFLLAAILVVAGACSQGKPGDLVSVKGGPYKNKRSILYGKSVAVSDFYIGKYEVTQKEWIEIMGNNPSQFKGDNLPVESVSWYDCIEYCIGKSIKEGLQPYYKMDKNKKDPNNKSDKDNIKWLVTINSGSNGYRLPLEAEWEYAAGGGQMSKSFTYSGSDNIDKVAWYWQNSGDKALEGLWNLAIMEANHNKTKPVGLKAPNELGLFDMSGNVREWCWDWHGESLVTNSGSERVWRGGGWLGIDQPCATSFRGYLEPFWKYNDTGFRVCRNK
jgi:formylglycine-generating enzyme